MDRGAGWATVYRVIKSWILLKGLSTHLTWGYKGILKKIHFLPPTIFIELLLLYNLCQFKMYKVMI